MSQLELPYSSADIVVNIFSNRLEVISLGGLVPGLTIQAIQRGARKPHNKKLANLFYRLALMESFGVGVNQILST